MTTPKELQKLLSEGINISQQLRNDQNVGKNTQDIIEITYDLQSGVYTKAMQDKAYLKSKRKHNQAIANIINNLDKPETILEAGIGEATCFSGVIQQLTKPVRSYGFDISWSRIGYAKKWLLGQGVTNTTLCTGDLDDIPFLENSMDIVFTSQSIEPNGGNEKRILQELYRVTRKYLILIEPDYESATVEIKKRMDSHGYCKNLQETIKALGYNIIRHEPFEISLNPLNPVAVTIISKQNQSDIPDSLLVCPKYKTPLIDLEEIMFSPEALVAYPKLNGIPCLRIENGIVASKYLELLDDET